MKNKKTYYLIILASVFFAFFVDTALAQDTTAITYIQIRVDGLSCPFCAYGLEKKLKKVDGAANLHIDLEGGIVSLDVPSDKKPSEDDLRKVVTDAGFTPRKIKFSDKPFKSSDDTN